MDYKDLRVTRSLTSVLAHMSSEVLILLEGAGTDGTSVEAVGPGLVCQQMAEMHTQLTALQATLFTPAYMTYSGNISNKQYGVVRVNHLFNSIASTNWQHKKRKMILTEGS